MHVGSIVLSFFVPLAAPFVALGCATTPSAGSHALAAAQPIAPKPEQDHRRVAGHVYRLDFVVASTNAASQTGGPTSGNFTMTLEEGRSGEIRSGSNVALTPTGGSRVDVGTMLKASYFTIGDGDDVLLESSAEMSSADDPGTIHKLVARGGALVSPGKPALIASAEDQAGRTRYQLTVTATKLR